MKRVISILLLCALVCALSAAQAATANMKKAKVSWNLTPGKNFTCYTLYGGLDRAVPIKGKITEYAMRSLNDTEAQIFFRLRMTNAFEPTDEEIHTLVNNMSGDTIGGIYTFCFTDYKTGLCLEGDNDLGVKVDRKEITLNKEKYTAADGYWIRINKEIEYELTVTFPKDYDGLCVGVLGRGTPFKSDADNAFWEGKAAFSETGYWDKSNKKISHFMQVNYEDDGRIDITKATIGKIKDRVYNGKAQKPNPKIEYNGTKLVKGTDYTLTYSDNVRVGAVAVTITGKGDYKWHVTKYFSIKKADLGSVAEVTMDKEKYEYTGQEIKPKLSVVATLNDEKVDLKEGVDYTVTYANNREPGIATMIISGFLNYEGSVMLNFEIVK